MNFRSKMTGVIAMGFFLLSGCANKNCDYSSTYIVQADGTNRITFNDTHSRARIAQKFHPNSAVTVYSVSFTIVKVGEPTGTLKVSIHSDDNDKPKKSAISDGGPVNVNLDEVGSTVLVEVETKLNGNPDLSSDRDYYIVLESSDPPSDTDYYQLGSVSTGSAYPDGEVWEYDSNEDNYDKAWSDSPSDDLQFSINKCEQNKNNSSN